MGLRGATLLSKFVLIFVLAKYMEPPQVALFGLLSSAVSYSLYALGFDFYNYSTRELIIADSSGKDAVIRNQATFQTLTCLVFLPILLFMFDRYFPGDGLLIWFCALLLSELFSQELYRMLIAYTSQRLASTVLFVRSGVWVYAAVTLMWAGPQFRQLEIVLLLWLFGAGLSCVIGVIAISRLQEISWRGGIDVLWIKRGLKVAVPLLLSTMALKGVFTFDKFIVETSSGLDIAAAYILYAGISMALLSFLDAGVFVFYYPKLISLWRDKKHEVMHKNLKMMLLKTILVCVIFVAAAYSMLDFVLGWLDKEVYIEHSYLLGWLLSASVLYSLSMVPHYALYASSHDKWIVVSHIICLMTFLVLTLLLVEVMGAVAVPIALNVSFGLLLMLKAALWLWERKHIA